MKLHENLELYKDAITATAQQMGIPEIYVEKDYWVTLALYNIFSSEVGSQAVFKGGTALSKCFGTVQRFSEDIDIVILKAENETGNQLKNKIKKISEVVAAVLPEIEVLGITNKFGMIRKTAHSYQKNFEGEFGQVRDIIILESTWLGSFEPYTTATVCSFVSEMMNKTGQSALIEDYNLLPFQVQVLSKERTLCEKIMSLVRFSFTENPIVDLNNKIRHIYDIHKLLTEKEINDFFKSDCFESMLLTVANDDVQSFKNNNDWLAKHPATALIFSDTTNAWSQLRNTYFSTFSELVYGDLPQEVDILNILSLVSERLKPINWTIYQQNN
jgi:predicted nucleotidyltransferase component of viral defense system